MTKAKSDACPICDKPSSADSRPFCSTRCADVDLGRWFNGSYAVPAVEPPDEWSEAETLDAPSQWQQ